MLVQHVWCIVKQAVCLSVKEMMRKMMCSVHSGQLFDFYNTIRAKILEILLLLFFVFIMVDKLAHTDLRCPVPDFPTSVSALKSPKQTQKTMVSD